MTPNYGYDPTDPRAQQQHGQGQPPQQPTQGSRQPPQHPQHQGAGGGMQGGQPPRQPPQGPPGQQGRPQQHGGRQRGAPGPGAQQAPPAGQAPPQGGPQPQSQPPMGGGMGGMGGGMGASGPQQRPERGPRRGQQQIVLDPITADDVVTEDVVEVKPDTPIRTAVAKMAEEDVGSVVVVEDDQPRGIVTDRKVALALEENPDVTQRNVEELVQDDVVTADSSMTIFDALQTMSDHKIRRLPVVDENGDLTGILTFDDAVVLIGGELGQLAETVQAQIDNL